MATALVGALEVRLADGPVQLLPQRAAYLPEQGLLLVADAHLGKAQAFRRRGVPVPGGTTQRNLQRLTDLIQATKPTRLVFLGDLLHAHQARSPALLASVGAWRQQHPTVNMRLVRGNHDDHAGDPPPDWDIAAVDEPSLAGPWALCHHPQQIASRHVIAGHVHPSFTVGRGVNRLRLPCFHLGKDCTVLPAFGEFTGLHAVRPRAGDRVALVGDGQVHLVGGESAG